MAGRTVKAQRPPPLCALVPVDDVEAHDPWAPVAFAREHADRHGGAVVAIVAGAHPADAVAAQAWSHGADRVCLVAHGGDTTAIETDVLTAAFERALVHPGLASGPQEGGVFLLPAGAVGEEVAARLAARFDGAALGRCIALSPVAGTMHARRSAYGGRVEVTLAFNAGPYFGAVRRPQHVTPTAPRAGGPGPIQRLDVELPPSPAGFVRREQTGGRAVPLTGARVIVSGGRGVGGEAGFEHLRALAQALGGVVGGSLPAVDAGWVPVTHQIGQSGKYVTPKVYVAVGISGTPQHMAGIGPDVRIVAINADAQADIFRVARIGIVADWRDVLPALIERLEQRAAAGDGSG